MASRADVLAKLQRELRHAQNVGEEKYISQLEAQIADYSRGGAANPATETTGRPAARKSRTA